MSRILNLGKLLLAFMVVAAPVWADAPAGIVAHHGKVFETEKAGLDTKGFIEIDNFSGSPDTLTNVACPIADATSIVSAGGQPISSLTVAPGQSLVMAANGPHLVLQSTHFSIDQGGAIPCSLTFQNAGVVSAYLYPETAP
jgi:copper(I)-binding protein